MKTVYGKRGQTLYDLCIQEYGSISMMYKLIQDNDNLRVNGYIPVSQPILIDDTLGNNQIKNYFTAIKNDPYFNVAFNNDIGFDSRYKIGFIQPETFTHNIYLLDGTTNTAYGTNGDYELDFGFDGIKGIDLQKYANDINIKGDLLDLSNQPNLRIVSFVAALMRKLILPHMDGLNKIYPTNNELSITLTNCKIYDINITSIFGNYYSVNIDIKGNNLTSAMVNTILYHFDKYVTFEDSGTIDVSGQGTGSDAPLNSTSGLFDGLAAKKRLEAKGWVITND